MQAPPGFHRRRCRLNAARRLSVQGRNVLEADAVQSHHTHRGSTLALLLIGALSATVFAGAARAQTAMEDPVPPPPPPDDQEGEPEAPPPDSVPPAQPPDQSTFDEQLSPYGQWVDTNDYGRVWVPSGVNSDWQPYTDGRWVDTDWGWSFASSVPWGWAAFHYGRWGFTTGLGWFWVPGFVWAPAWVAWRYSPGFVCWSPFAPVGFAFGHHWPGWVAIRAGHFRRPIGLHLFPRVHSASIIRASHPVSAIGSARAQAGFHRAGGFQGGRGFQQNAFGGGGVRGHSASPGNIAAPRNGAFGGNGAFRGIGPPPGNGAFRGNGAFHRGGPSVGNGIAYRNGGPGSYGGFRGNGAFHSAGRIGAGSASHSNRTLGSIGAFRGGATYGAGRAFGGGGFHGFSAPHGTASIGGAGFRGGGGPRAGGFHSSGGVQVGKGFGGSAHGGMGGGFGRRR